MPLPGLIPHRASYRHNQIEPFLCRIQNVKGNVIELLTYKEDLCLPTLM